MQHESSVLRGIAIPLYVFVAATAILTINAFIGPFGISSIIFALMFNVALAIFGVVYLLVLQCDSVVDEQLPLIHHASIPRVVAMHEDL
jgi:hypothetical protein